MEPLNSETNETLINDTALGSKAIEHEEEKEESKKKRWILLLLLLLALLAVVAFIGFKLLDKPGFSDSVPVAVMPDMDGNAQDINTREALEKAMQQEADAAYFTLQVNPEASFSSASTEGSFELINPSSNVYPISFVLTLDENKQEIYRSGSVMPGQEITNITLNTKLSPGAYSATVSVSIYNDTTHEQEGETQAKINLIVT